MNKRIKPTVSVRSIPGASANGMAHHVNGCLEDISPDNVILHHETNDLKSGNTSEEIATSIVSLALTIQGEKTKVFISGLSDYHLLSEMTISIKDGKKLINFCKKMFSWKIKFYWQEHKLENVKSKRTSSTGMWN